MNATSLGLLAFAAAASFTPGPNNAMVAAIAARHGLRASLAPSLGIVLGFALMLLVVGSGVAGVLAALPVLAGVLRWASFAWLLVLAWKIARAGAPGEGHARPPLGFLGAAAFQWINPKAWFIALAASGAWEVPGRPLLPQALTIAGVFLVVSLASVLSWAALGSAAARLLREPARLRAFNVGMAVLMVASMLPAVLGE